MDTGVRTGRSTAALGVGWVRLIAGLFCFASGTFLTLRADLGVPPWDVLHDGLRLNTPLTFGVATILVGLVLLIVSLFIGVRPGPGTIANMILIGVFVDLMLASSLFAGVGDGPLALQVLTSVTGIVIVGIGSALYIGAELGAGPRDSLMVAIATRFKLRVGIARAIVEGTALALGAILGGSVGLGTALFVLGIGPAVDLSFALFRMDASGRRKGPRATV